MVEHCHAGKSLCRVSAGIAVVFPTIFGPNVPIRLNAEKKLGTMYIWLCRRCWSVAGLPHDILCLVLSLSIFHSNQNTMHKVFLFCRCSTCSHVKSHRSTSFGFNSYGTQCPCFLIVSKRFKRFETIMWSTAKDSAISATLWHGSSWSNSSKFSVHQSLHNYSGCFSCSFFQRK